MSFNSIEFLSLLSFYFNFIFNFIFIFTNTPETTTSFSNHLTNKIELPLHCSRDAPKSHQETFLRATRHWELCVYLWPKGYQWILILSNIKKKCIVIIENYQSTSKCIISSRQLEYFVFYIILLVFEIRPSEFFKFNQHNHSDCDFF